MYLYIIVGLLIAIVAVSFRKNQSKEHLENCNLNINNTNSNGRKTFFTNFMLDEYLNKNGRIDRLKENNIETKTTLANYKQKVYDGNTEYNRLNTEYNLFNNNMDTQFNKSNAALQNKMNETKNLKQSAIDKFNRIDNKMINVVGNPESSLETKLKPFVDASINTNLDKIRDQSINNITPDTVFNNRMTQLAGDNNKWKIIPGYGCPMRVDPNSGDIQCLSYDGKNCEWNFVNQNGSDLTKINNNSVKPLSCGADHKSKYNSEGYDNKNHWCKGVYDYFAKNFITQVDWTNCPVGWKNVNQNGTSCQAPNDYNGPCSKISGFSNYSNENKQNWAASCTARWPFKLNLNSTVNNLGKISSVIDKDIEDKIGRIVPRTELDNVNTYNNGVYVQVYKLGPNNNPGDKLQDGIITTNINFNWGVGLIFGIRENNNETNTNTIYLEMTGFLKTPGNATSIKFKLTSDDGSRLIFSNTVEISNMSIVIDMWKSPGTSKVSSSISVTPNQYLPFQLQFYENYGAANLKLEWSINGSAFSVIPRESFFVNKEICNYRFNFNFVKEINTRAQSIIPKTAPLFTISNPSIPLLSVPDFPFLGLMPNWEMNINFNVNGRQNSWRALIGDMYNNTNHRGWGIWVTPSNNNIHFSWQSNTWNAEPAFNILPNTNYNLKITRNPTSLTLLLTNLNTNISQTSTNNSISQYVMTTNGPVTIGGWKNYSGENFPGTISNINVIGNKREYLLGIGTDTKLWYMPADFSRGWTQVSQDNCCVTSMSQMNDGTLLGVRTSKCLYTKSSINGNWKQVDCQPSKSAIQLKDGTLLGVNMENKLWTKTKFTDNQSLVAQNNCCVTSIIQLNDGTLLGVGTDNNIYTKQNLNGEWSQVSGGCCVKSITQLQNGTFVGVGTDNNLWYKSSLTAPWQSKGNCCVTNVVSIMM